MITDRRIHRRRGVERLTAGDLAGHPAVPVGNVLDLRHAEAFAAGHVRGAMSFPLPTPADTSPAELRRRLAEELPSIFLPPRHEPLLIVADDPPLALAVAEILHERGRWWTAACGLADAGALPPIVPLAAGSRSGRLWSPPPFLRRWRHLLPPPAAGPLLDLACGSGRASVWLACRGWRVTGLDHQPEALALGRRLAASAAVAVDFRAADLRDPGSLPAGPWAGVLLFRFLDRGLNARLPRVLGRPAVLMLRTFRDAPGYVGNPQPRHRLGRGEAAGFWMGEGAEVLVHEEGFDADGKPATGLVARWSGVT